MAVKMGQGQRRAGTARQRQKKSGDTTMASGCSNATVMCSLLIRLTRLTTEIRHKLDHFNFANLKFAKNQPVELALFHSFFLSSVLFSCRLSETSASSTIMSIELPCLNKHQQWSAECSLESRPTRDVLNRTKGRIHHQLDSISACCTIPNFVLLNSLDSKY